jgi:predicted signal transduction protein with EAL and GGDEF domain
LPDEHAALMLGHRIAAALNGSCRVGAAEVHLGASVGIGWTVPGDLDEETVVNRADAAMYASKREAAGQPCLYTPELDAARRQLPASASIPLARGPRLVRRDCA